MMLVEVAQFVAFYIVASVILKLAAMWAQGTRLGQALAFVA